MTPDFTLIWPLSCPKDGVHLFLPSYPQHPSNPHHPPGGSSLIAHRNSLFCPTRFPVPKLGNSLFARNREMVANSLNQ